LILIIACINFINLSTARAANRTKEIGLRKVVGAQRRDLIFQFFGESNILAFISLLLALLLISLLLPTFNQMTGKQVDLEFILVPQILLGILGITLFTGVISGIYPALLLSSFHPVRIFKGLKTMGKGGQMLRKILVVTQFTLSIVMIISTMMIYQQLQYIKTKDLGFNKEQLAYLYMSNNQDFSFLALKNELTSLPGVLRITASSDALYRGLPSTSGVQWQGKNPNELVLFNFLRTDYNFLETLKIKMKAGRFFSKDMRTDIKNAYVINEAAVKAMGMSNPIGKSFTTGNTEGCIIGVIKDFNFRSLHTSIEPLFVRLRENQLPYFILRLKPGDQAATIASIKKIWEKFVPGFPFEFGFIDEKIDNYYQVERRMGKLFIYAAILAVVISCLGLFGLASFTAHQKRKEIGIRKVLGAKIFSIIRLLSMDFSRWVILANLAAWPIAYFFIKKLLQNYAYRVPLRIETFIVAGFISIIIALITVTYQTIKAAQTNPVNTLRHE
jgi:ABC-type antimicrobial peptide transport system permease subunit